MCYLLLQYSPENKSPSPNKRIWRLPPFVFDAETRQESVGVSESSLLSNFTYCIEERYMNLIIHTLHSLFYQHCFQQTVESGDISVHLFMLLATFILPSMILDALHSFFLCLVFFYFRLDKRNCSWFDAKIIKQPSFDQTDWNYSNQSWLKKKKKLSTRGARLMRKWCRRVDATYLFPVYIIALNSSCSVEPSFLLTKTKQISNTQRRYKEYIYQH